MAPPLVSFVTWNRMGLTVRNLTALLKCTDDFELHIADSSSRDDTWDYIEALGDPRIKAKTRFDSNRGPIYAVNYNLSKRKKDQYFFAVDNDVNIHTTDFVTRFLAAFEAFPSMGLLGAASAQYYSNYRQPAVVEKKDGISCIRITRGFVEGCCQCFRPKVFEYIGYWCEENCMGDMEMSYRICNFTPYTAGYLPSVEIDQLQEIPCKGCEGRKWCSLDKKDSTCFTLHHERYQNPGFRAAHGWKYRRFTEELEKGKRPLYCASIHDRASIREHFYDRKLAEENFNFYVKNSN